jgi:16S rRNA (cytidine1402-2'-O)-methyltransferase
VGTLFIVATPIGNLSDMTYRAVETLTAVDLIAAEDTRHSRKLLQHYSIGTPTTAYHEHNEQRQTRNLIGKLLSGDSIALITDAGTPLVSDPGYRLICAAHQQKIPVSPIPGCCATVAALSVAGLPTDRFAFEGFLPNKVLARRKTLELLKFEPRTLVFYESAHRIIETLTDLVQVFGPDRPATLAREITKQFETIENGTLAHIHQFVGEDPNQQKGEFVLLVQGAGQPVDDSGEILVVLRPLMAAMRLKQAVDLTAKITGKPKNEIYSLALQQKPE